MVYQPIECDHTVKNPLICDDSNYNDFGFKEEDFIAGKIISNWPEGIIFKATEKLYDGTPDDVLQNADMIPIYSQRLKTALEKLEIEGIQYLPIKVQGFDGTIYENFHIANITNVVNAFDYEKSIYRFFPEDFPNPNVRGNLTGIRKFVLKSSEINNCDIFRLAEYSRRFFVTDKIKKVFSKEKFSGYSFIKVDCS